MIGGHVARDLVAYHDGLLNAAERARVDAHLARCVRCRRRSDAIAESRQFLAVLAPRQMPAERAAAIRASLRFGAARELRGSRARWSIAAAAALSVVFLYLLLRPPVSFVAPAAPPRSIERSAVAVHRDSIAGTFRVDYRSGSAHEVRRFVATQLGVGASIPLHQSSRQGPRHELLGVSAVAIEGGARGAAIAYRIGGQPVFLVTSTELRDRPRDRLFGKRVELRRQPSGTRTLTWSGSDETYTLVVPAGVAVAEACAICHQDADRLALIRRHSAGL